MRQSIRFLGLVFILIFYFTNSYSQYNKFVPEFSTIMSSNKGGELLKQCSRAIPEKVDSFFNLTDIEIKGLENNFKKVLKLKASSCCLSGGLIKNLKRYCYQYIGLIINNRRYIYINAFQIDSSSDLTTIYKDWKLNPVVACDGGDSYWGVLYDLDKGEFLQLSVNGES